MRRLFWLIVLIGSYVWVVSTGREQFVLNQGMIVYEWIKQWISEAEFDFQIDSKEKTKYKKKVRRWD